MRIDCEQCGVAFTIDDALVSERGVRAQCPRCGGLKVVHKADPAAPTPSANPFAPQPPGPNPLAQTSRAAAQPSANPSTNPSTNPFAPAPTGNAFSGAEGNPFAGPPPATNPFAAPAPAPAPAAAPPPASNPFAPPTAHNPFQSAAAPASLSAPPPPSENPFAAGAAQNPFAAPGAGKPFAPPPPSAGNPFAPPPPSPPAAGNPFSPPPPSAPAAGNPFSPPPPAGNPFAPPAAARTNGPAAPDPFGAQPAADVRTDPLGSVAAGQGASSVDDPFAAIETQLPPGPTTATSPTRAASGQVALPERPRAAGARAEAGFSLRNIPGPALAAGLVVIVVGAGLLAWGLKPEWFEGQTDAGVNPLRGTKSEWARQFPDVDGTARDHVVEGRAWMRKDTAAGARKADEEFRQALLLDIGNVPGIAGWVENLAQLPTVRADFEISGVAKEAIAFGLRKEPGSIELRRAQAALQLTLGEVDAAQRTLTTLLRDAPTDIDASVLLARSHIERNPQDALRVITEVRTRSPDLPAALVIEGAAQRRLGAFAEARKAFETRLVQDPANVSALKELAKLELDLGRAPAAQTALTKLVDAEDRDVEAQLLRAKVAYQIIGGDEANKDADRWLSDVLARHENSAGELLLLVLSHAAFIKVQLGDVDKAVALGERAGATDASFPPALLVLSRIYAKKGDVERAAKVLDQAVRAVQQREQFYEPLVRAEMAAMQSHRHEDNAAVRNWQQVIDYDARNLRAHFGLAAHYIRIGRSTEAMTIMRRALDTDPAHDRDRRVPTDFPLPPEDLIPFADAFRDAKIDMEDDSLLSLKLSSEGVIRFHAGQRRAARALLQQALAPDPYNHAALLYLAVLEQEDGGIQEPKTRLQLAAETTGTGHAITRLYLARAEARAGELNEARKRLTELIESEPTLVQARHELALVLGRQKEDAAARTLLKDIVLADPDYLPAKQALAAVP